MADVFLSYARPDAAVAERIARAARRARLVRLVRSGIPAHETFADVAITAELEKARAVLVLWSGAAVELQWVRSGSEPGALRNCDKLVQMCRLGKALPMPFDQIAVRRFGLARLGHGWSQVLHSLSTPWVTRARPKSPAAGPGCRDANSFVRGCAVAAIAGGGYLSWRALERPSVSPQAQLLIERGLAALQSTTDSARIPKARGSTCRGDSPAALTRPRPRLNPRLHGAAASQWPMQVRASASPRWPSGLDIDMRSRSAATARPAARRQGVA